MKKTIRRRHEARRRAQAICEENRSVIEATDGGRKTLARFNASVDAVNSLFAAGQQALNDRRVAQADLAGARRQLREILKALVDVSAIVTLDEGSAKLMDLPEITSDEQLLADANAVYGIVSAHTAAFVAEGLPDNVVNDLQTQIATFVRSKKASSTARKTFTAARRAAVDELRTGQRALAVIDAILAQSPLASPQALTKLRLAKRIGYDHPKPAAVPEPVPTTPTKAA